MKERFRFVLTVIFVIASIDLSTSLWSGPRITHCYHMMPGHGYEPQKGDSPFKVTFDVKKHPPPKINKVVVRIASDDLTNFVGFFIQVRAIFDYRDKVPKNWTVYGDWSCREKHTKTLDCQDEMNVNRNSLVFLSIFTYH